MGVTGLRICERCRALEKVGDDRTRPCRICGFPGPDRRAMRPDPLRVEPLRQ